MSASETTREVGVEIELGGLPEDVVAEQVARWLDGRASKDGDFQYKIEGGPGGEWRVELDTAWKTQIAEAGVPGAQIARGLIPVEIVTPPLPEAKIAGLDALLERLAGLGAKGSRDALVGAYGIHFNPVELHPDTHLFPVVQAYAALEPWLREISELDMLRRALPFIDPWPRGLVETLMAWNGPDMDIASVISVYTEHVRSRNHGLDMLPLLLHLDRELVERRIGPDHGVSARPTYHFRLPECRLDEPGWSLTSEWAKWQLVEAVAADRATLDRIRTDRLLSGDPVAAARTHLEKYLSQEVFACLVRS